MADETDSKSVVSDGVWVRVPPPAPPRRNELRLFRFFCFTKKSVTRYAVPPLQSKAAAHLLIGFCFLQASLFLLFHQKLLRTFCWFFEYPFYFSSLTKSCCASFDWFFCFQETRCAFSFKTWLRFWSVCFFTRCDVEKFRHLLPDTETSCGIWWKICYNGLTESPCTKVSLHRAR